MMAEYECICKHCAFADACPSAYFPANKMKCADLQDMRISLDNTRTPMMKKVIGKSVFMTKEEAEKAIDERRKKK